MSLPADSPALPDFSRGHNGLLPAIAQDADNGDVLMLAWMNETAWRQTLETGKATYFSRSRNSIWCKGETSGHVQEVVEARIDCDADTILLRVRQAGAACHDGYRSCFYRTLSADSKVQINAEVLVDPDSVYKK
ncbi:phosphoribosyl-AMP cyclohydrolase [Roseimaritima multifibrata]|uniref:Phosphoribosyl-AMP cyclohydrolase n=1 Tax=Roseimaritima multifibrata TaxID=1930274 RepID=A0A517MG49_9BACT|nr:phosphoribosyl-AMP cyclohydrolase [Roseimaritima multifibrata]QDS93858.1 phosphoribosyl-AMP cyclohydrolase [Roseimaritima multifibrata]